MCGAAKSLKSRTKPDIPHLQRVQECCQFIAEVLRWSMSFDISGDTKRLEPRINRIFLNSVRMVDMPYAHTHREVWYTDNVLPELTAI